MTKLNSAKHVLSAKKITINIKLIFVKKSLYRFL